MGYLFCLNENLITITTFKTPFNTSSNTIKSIFTSYDVKSFWCKYKPISKTKFISLNLNVNRYFYCNFTCSQSVLFCKLCDFLFASLKQFIIVFSFTF